MLFTKLLMSVNKLVEAYGYPLILKKIKTSGTLSDYRIYGNSKQDELPENFEQLEYIESTGEQFINTGIMSGKFVHDIEFTSTDRNLMGFSTTAGTFWGAREQADGYELGTSVIHTNTLERQIVNYNVLNGEFTLEANDEKITYNNSSIINPYCLLHINSSEYFCKAKVYSFHAYNNSGELIQSLIPARRKSDSSIGMFDTVTNTFFHNSGTREFIAGDKVEPSSTNPIEIRSVGIKSRNLFDKNQTLTINTFLNPDGTTTTNNFWDITDYIPVNGYEFTLTRSNEIGVAPCIVGYDIDKNVVASTSYDNVNTVIHLTSDKEIRFIRFSINRSSEILNSIQLEEGNIATKREQYGYRISITARNKTNTQSETVTFYIQEPLRRVDNYADYIDFKNQRIVKNVKVIDNTGTKPINDSFRILTEAIEEAIQAPELPKFEGTTIYTVEGLEPSDMYGIDN